MFVWSRILREWRVHIGQFSHSCLETLSQEHEIAKSSVEVGEIPFQTAQLLNVMSRQSKKQTDLTCGQKSENIRPQKKNKVT